MRRLVLVEAMYIHFDIQARLIFTLFKGLLTQSSLEFHVSFQQTKMSLMS
jgi:hypothetical protein